MLRPYPSVVKVLRNSSLQPQRHLSFALLAVAAGAVSAGVAIGVFSEASRDDLLYIAAAMFATAISGAFARASRTMAGFCLAALVIALYLLPVDYLPIHKQVASFELDPVIFAGMVGFVAPGFAVSRRLLPSVFQIVLLIAGLVALIANYGLAPRYYYMSYLVAGSIIYVAASRGSRSRSDLRAGCLALMLAGGLASTLGIVEFILKKNPVFGHDYPSAGSYAGKAVYFQGSTTFRITTSIGTPLEVAGLLVVALIVSVGYHLLSETRRERQLSLGIAALCFVALMMTRSRAAVIIAPISVLLLLVALRRQPRARAVALRLTAALVIGLFATNGIWLTRFSSASQASTQARTLGFSYFEHTIPDAVPFGLGYGSSQARVGSRGVTVASASPEDGWLELLVDAGPIVMGALIILTLSGPVLAIRRPETDPLRVTMAVATFALLVYGFAFNGIVVIRTFLFVMFVVSAMSMPNRTAVETANTDW